MQFLLSLAAPRRLKFEGEKETRDEMRLPRLVPSLAMTTYLVLNHFQRITKLPILLIFPILLRQLSTLNSDPYQGAA